MAKTASLRSYFNILLSLLLLVSFVGFASAATAETPSHNAPPEIVPIIGFFATITGAVVGALGSTTGIIIVIFVVVVVGLTIYFSTKPKPKKGKRERNID